MRLIKRYQNRKLYDVETSTYTTLTEIDDLLCAGVDVVVHDVRSERDVTREVLWRVLLDKEERADFPTPVAYLKEFIVNGLL